MPYIKVQVTDSTVQKIDDLMDKLGLVNKGGKGTAIDLAMWCLTEKEMTDMELILTEFENFLLGEEE